MKKAEEIFIRFTSKISKEGFDYEIKDREGFIKAIEDSSLKTDKSNQSAMSKVLKSIKKRIMKTQKHTSGKWEVYNAEIDSNSRIEIKTDEIISVGVKYANHTKAVAFCGYNKNPDAIANAKLIAAAPELLSICLSILKDDEQEGTLLPLDRVKLKNAIHNATV